MNLTTEDIQRKIDQLREAYKAAPESSRKLIEIRGKLLKRALEGMERKYGRKLIA